MRCFLALVAMAAAGCAQENIDAIDNVLPEADAGQDRSVARGVPLQFDGTGSLDPDGEVVAFAWEFGDGGTAEGALPQHIFNAGGTFTVLLTVTDDDGGVDTDEMVVLVDDNQPPVAVIDAPDSVGQAQNVRFDGSLSTDADGTVSSWSWDFGDGTTGAGTLVDHVFTDPGTYTVTLTCTDDKGALGSVEHVIEVAESAAGYSGTWNWFLVDPNQRDLGGLCGSFQDSTLTILIAEPNMTITESAGGFTQSYAGSITGDDFSVAYTGTFGDVQGIAGTFTSSTTFEGVYTINPGFGEVCADRAVTGVKVAD